MFEFGGAAGIAGLLVVGPLLLDVKIATVLVILALFVRLLPRVSALQQGLQALNVLMPALDNLQRLRDEARALDGVDLDLPPGRIVAIVGPSGSGKSTLVDAVLGIVPLSSGLIEIGGIALDDLPLPAWRRTIGYVGQDTALFAGSVADNVRLGTQAGAEAVEAALDKAAAHFVRRLAAGVNTEVGDCGARLSGGERQRLGLARALAAQRRLFVLDEATSALDSETEAEVMRTVEGIAGEATVLIVAHRFSAVRGADIIHVLENGRIVESGDWSSLDQLGTRFYMLKQLQEMKQP